MSCAARSSTAEAEILKARSERGAAPPSDPSEIPARIAAATRRLLETYDDAKAAARWDPKIDFLSRYRTADYIAVRKRLYDREVDLVRAGLKPSDVLRAATLDAARFLGLQDTLGSVERGKIAALVLVRGNPLSDIRSAERIEAVVAGGSLYTRGDLDAMLAGVEKEVR